MCRQNSRVADARWRWRRDPPGDSSAATWAGFGIRALPRILGEKFPTDALARTFAAARADYLMKTDV
jgi:hypothetical protein